MKLRVWWIPQIPMKPFHVEVESVGEGNKLLRVLADYDKFQLENNIKPAYSNAGGLQVFDPHDDTDAPEGSWVDWCEDDEPCDECGGLGKFEGDVNYGDGLVAIERDCGHCDGKGYLTS